jgi:hypothetical protein
VLLERRPPKANRLSATRHRHLNPRAMVPQRPGRGMTLARPKRFPNSRIRRRWLPNERLQIVHSQGVTLDQGVQQLPKGAELEASRVWAAPGKRIRVLHKATLPKPESHSFPPRRFLPTPESAGSMDQRGLVTCHAQGVLTCTTAQPALRVVVRCSQVPRWGQTK